MKYYPEKLYTLFLIISYICLFCYLALAYKVSAFLMGIWQRKEVRDDGKK